jgi:AraC-type DNA-binding domain-containing proteins
MVVTKNIFAGSELQPDEIEISLQSGQLPLSYRLDKISRCIVCYCLEGEAEIEVNLTKHKFTQSEIVMLFPNQIVQQHSVSSSFNVMYFTLAPHILQEVTFRFPPEFLSFLRQHFYYRVGQAKIEQEQVRFSILHRKYHDTESICRREFLMNLLRNYFLEIYDQIWRDELLNSTRSYGRKNDLYEAFTTLVMKQYREHREVKHYAAQLCISPKYLSSVVASLSTYSAKEWIDDYVILELKVRLKSGSDSLQKIADEFHFPDLAYMSNYFKTRTGISPSTYRFS